MSEVEMARGLRDVLERQREMIMASMRKVQPVEVRKLESVELALKNLEQEPIGIEFATFRLTIDAVEAYLKKTGYVCTGKDIVTAVVEGGGGKTKSRGSTTEGAELNVRESIRYNLRNKEITKKIRVMRGPQFPKNKEEIDAALIGLYDWQKDHP